MKKIISVWLTWLIFNACIPTHSFGAPATLVEIFSTEMDPGEGQLQLGAPQDPKAEKFSLGKEQGRYGFAMVLPSKSLAPKHRETFKNLSIIQVAFGNLKSRLDQNFIPQFCTASFFVEKLPRSTQTLEIIHNPEKQKDWNKAALIWVTSPDTSSNAGDEDKLRSTYFGTLGTVVLTPLGLSKDIVVNSNTGKLTFSHQIYQMDFDVTLSTPFSPDKKKFTGNVRIPVYRPKGKAATDFSRDIASSSTPEGLEAFKTKTSLQQITPPLTPKKEK